MSVRRDPFEAMERMFDQMRRGGFPAEPVLERGRDGAFDANVSLEREDDGFVVVADLPGFEREEIDVTYADRTLTIAGTHEDGDGQAYRSRSVGESIAIPEAVDHDGTAATYRNGVLEVRLPLVDGADDAHHIDIA